MTCQVADRYGVMSCDCSIQYHLLLIEKLLIVTNRLRTTTIWDLNTQQQISTEIEKQGNAPE